MNYDRQLCSKCIIISFFFFASFTRFQPSLKYPSSFYSRKWSLWMKIVFFCCKWFSICYFMLCMCSHVHRPAEGNVKRFMLQNKVMIWPILKEKKIKFQQITLFFISFIAEKKIFMKNLFVFQSSWCSIIYHIRELYFYAILRKSKKKNKKYLWIMNIVNENLLNRIYLTLLVPSIKKN